MDRQSPLKDSPQLVIDGDFMSIRLSKAHSLLILKWKRQITLEERKQGFTEALALTRKYHLESWLVDDLQLYIITPEEKEWVLNDFQKVASRSTLLRLAVVTSDYYPALMSNTEFTEKSKEGYNAKGAIQHEVFTEFDIALDWLLHDRES